MKRALLFVLVTMLGTAAGGGAPFEADTFTTDAGTLEITFIGHGTLVFDCGGTIIHIDPWSRLADYRDLPKADIVLITHEHRDHLDPGALETVSTENTVVICTEACAKKGTPCTVMKNGDEREINGIRIQAVPAYNIVHKRENGDPFHPRGVGNGYIVSYGEMRVYIAGDTENIPEMKELEDIDIAFLPMNLPYTMTPEMVADAARAFKPRILYPYHFGDTDTARIVELLRDRTDIEVRVRSMK